MPFSIFSPKMKIFLVPPPKKTNFVLDEFTNFASVAIHNYSKLTFSFTRLEYFSPKFPQITTAFGF
jgi:hypothetical protein